MNYISPSDGKVLSASINRNGRVVIPAAMRKQLGFTPGTKLLFKIEDGELRVYSRMQAIKRMQDYCRKHVPKDVSLVDELFAERRREFEKEEAEYKALMRRSPSKPRKK